VPTAQTSWSDTAATPPRVLVPGTWPGTRTHPDAVSFSMSAMPPEWVSPTAQMMPPGVRVTPSSSLWP